jgi:Tfp pilus assembly protein PilN
MKYTINLMPAKEAPLMERLVYFSLNYLRYIIILTQLVVIGVFFYRFQIDQRIIDLKEAVEQKKEIIQVVLPLLSEAEIIDKRTIEARKIIKEQERFNQMVRYSLSLFPQSLTLTKLEMENDGIKMTGLALDVRVLQSFYSLLQKEKKFAVVSLTDIKKGDNGYAFILILNKFKEG